MSGKVGMDWFPLLPGHEVVCAVVQVPEEAALWGFKVGDLTKAKGVHIAGFFSEYTTLDAASTVLISRNFGVNTPLKGLDKPLCPIFCAGITIWDGLEQTKLGVSESVGVVGAGDLGQLATAFLTILGHKVVVMDVQEKQLVACKEEYPGVETINSDNCSDLATKLREVNDGNLLNVAFVTSGVKAAYDSTLPLLEPYGKLIVIGHPPKPLEISAYMMSDKRLR
ncbi:hypothetical protein COCSADRAFT_162326 [Bipolaris sorokiniana ND90Pr]|uniref:Alcohol dehydrogenase-like C-terminal domain-containing protein n=1 Tax=Cochliobolus sativus (strain ND90Pr / ATCC 201652) TaxID=665912 RepID=M2SY98_COCSN|nr:uncharacterized protein COCSADRAFT_162326 [Bipolaris sorokiniana ND90Pr]EMD61782.1 hypothetical protein COCSADRAFT_162326 [Bipolaris sorokiniana ND90Pr]